VRGPQEPRAQKDAQVFHGVPLRDLDLWPYSQAIVPRQSTGYTDLKQAEALRASMLSQIRGDAVSGLPRGTKIGTFEELKLTTAAIRPSTATPPAFPLAAQ